MKKKCKKKMWDAGVEEREQEEGGGEKEGGEEGKRVRGRQKRSKVEGMGGDDAETE